MFYRYNYSYTPIIIFFCGKRSSLEERLRGSGLHIKSACGEKYILEGDSYIRIYEYPTVISAIPLRSIVPSKAVLRKRYHRTNITEEVYAKLVTDLNNGLITFDSLL
ncbi:MAG: hypothetical protein IKD76_00690 [Clostridia bacterium]|nr:hypothetical protein [Clostridia bacterium]